ncbi:hypothetical protein CYMTET_40109 [Cymbomonas tetramitiformis]|uniref:Uncharacterized protein n=1 Tax=Cymbomonas tetramitiformis TaxID=36881 RepID=A0AAE0F3U5_9CHLO|nr:hypothetical protein CYMTET_40109 [Cymbomonas tetramitiformis]
MKGDVTVRKGSARYLYDANARGMAEEERRTPFITLGSSLKRWSGWWCWRNRPRQQRKWKCWGIKDNILIEFQRLEEAILEDLPEELEGPTEDLVEVDLLTNCRHVVRGEWQLGEPGDRWEKLRGEAAKERRRALAWATAAQDMQQALRMATQPSPNGSRSSGSGGSSPKRGRHSDDEVQRMVAAAVNVALEERDASGKGGGSVVNVALEERDASGKGGGSGMPVTPPKSLREVSKQSMGKRLNWTWTDCERVILEIRVAAAQQAADLARVKHIFGRKPAGRLEV